MSDALSRRLDAPLEAALSLLAPARVILVGAPGPSLRLAVEWARPRAALALLRQASAAGHRPGDLLVCERAALLPPAALSAAAALLPTDEASRAQERGWAPVEVATGPSPVTLMVASSSAARALAPRLHAYARERVALSRDLRALAALPGRDGGSAPAPPVLPSAGRPAPNGGRSCTVSIVVGVYNAAAELRRCLTALARHTTWPAELVLVDDASSDPEIAEILSEAAGLSGVRVLRSAVNHGFTATVNRALRATDGDVVLLNSDTEVGPRWLEHLVQAAHSRPGIATVTAISDNAGAFAVPQAGVANATPLALDGAGVARLLAQSALGRVAAPTGNGFCLLVSRAAIDLAGGLDADAFPRGYGEENDFCMRTLRAGWTHLVDGRTFVRHVRGASFDGERTRLAAPARARLDERYPEYTGLVREFAGGEQMTLLRERVAEAYRSAATPRPRLLFVIHEGGGGTWIANLELMRALEPEWEPYLLTSDRRTLRLWRVEDGELRPDGEWTLERRIGVTDFQRDDYRAVVREVLEDRAIELVHVRHLFKHTLDVPRVAASLGVPVVFSFHDFYFVCPTVNLLDDRDRYCAGECTAGDGACRVPPAGLEGLPHLKHAYVYEWREEVEAMLRHADAFVTTSSHARSVHTRALASLRGRPFELVEHGRTLSRRGGIAATPRPGKPIRILVIANLAVHKGSEYIRAMRAADGGDRLEFHFLGDVPDAYADLGVRHGRFSAEELAERAQAIGPAFVGCFSIAAETWSHSLTEAWAMGIPVIATDLGAFGERLRAGGGGRLVPVDDPAAAARTIGRVADDEDAYRRLREESALRGCASVAAMTDAYAALYRTVVDDRRAFVAAADGASPQLARGTVRLLAVVAGAAGVHPGSAFVRVIQRFRHPSVSEKLSLRLRTPEDDPLRPDTDIVLVQRTALDPAETDHFLAALRHRDVPLVLDLDDHLLLKGLTDPDYGSHQDSLARLIEAARLVLVSTPALATALAERAREVVVVPNLIDERLFLTGVEHCPRAVGELGRPLRIVYVGSPTHARDLAMLRPVLAELERTRPGGFELEVVGAEPAGPGQGWYRRVPVPDACKPYPHFVPWLRSQRPRWDVALAPLRDDEFNRFKSDLKYLEYSALGVPGVYSDVEPYATVRQGMTGLKVGTGVSEWVEALGALADDRALADRIADAAFLEVTSGRLLRHGADELLRIVCRVADERRRSGPGRRPDPMMGR